LYEIFVTVGLMELYHAYSLLIPLTH
jgi:hypothetical protein